MGTFKLTAVVELHFLITPLLSLNWTWYQSLVVYFLMYMATHIYGSTPEETPKREYLASLIVKTTQRK
jgi:hypothetical protein